MVTDAVGEPPIQPGVVAREVAVSVVASRMAGQAAPAHLVETFARSRLEPGYPVDSGSRSDLDAAVAELQAFMDWFRSLPSAVSDLLGEFAILMAYAVTDLAAATGNSPEQELLAIAAQLGPA